MRNSLYTGVSLVFLSTLAISGCGTPSRPASTQTPTNATQTQSKSKPQRTSQTPQQAAEQIISLSEHQQWDVLYTHLDSDVTAKYTLAQFVADRNTYGGAFALVQKVSVGTPSTLSTWLSPDTGKTYKNVADVPFTLTMSGSSVINGSMHLVKDSSGQWKYFWAPTSTPPTTNSVG